MLKKCIINLVGLFLRLFCYRLLIKRGECVVFMLHRVLSIDQELPLDNALYISVPKFEKMIKILSKRFKIVDLFHWVKSPENSRCCAITFDDGWKDNYDNAFPILKVYNVPATIFISAGMVNTNSKFWFYKVEEIIKSLEPNEILKYFEGILNIDSLNIVKKADLNWIIVDNLKKYSMQKINRIINDFEKRYSIVFKRERTLLNWDEMEEMSKYRIAFGSHGLNHAVFTELPDDVLRDEVVRSKQILKSKDIYHVPMMSFPNGSYNQNIISICEESGYEILLTASIKECGEGNAKTLIHRIGINDDMVTNFNKVYFKILQAKLGKKILNKNSK